LLPFDNAVIAAIATIAGSAVIAENAGSGEQVSRET
jgi:hypothetical protein